MATSSITTHMTRTIQGGRPSRHSSAKLRPVAMPSLADSVCSSMAMRLLATTTHSSV